MYLVTNIYLVFVGMELLSLFFEKLEDEVSLAGGRGLQETLVQATELIWISGVDVDDVVLFIQVVDVVTVVVVVALRRELAVVAVHDDDVGIHDEGEQQVDPSGIIGSRTPEVR